MTEFPLEKILNVTPTEYCSSVGRELKEFELVGVHATTGYDGDPILDVFRNSVPHNAEVVVNYTPHYAVTRTLFSAHKIERAEGTALVPKK